MLFGVPIRLTLDSLNRRSKIRRALRGSELPHDQECVYARDLEIPSGGGEELNLRPETLRALTYVTSQMGTSLTGDLRDVALRDTLYAVIQTS